MSRTNPRAVLNDLDAVTAPSIRLATAQETRAIAGSILLIEARNICLHDDTPGAVAMAPAVKAALLGAGVAIESFV